MGSGEGFRNCLDLEEVHKELLEDSIEALLARSHFAAGWGNSLVGRSFVEGIWMAPAELLGIVELLAGLEGPGDQMDLEDLVGNYLPWGSTAGLLKDGQLGRAEGKQACWERFYRTKAHNLQSGDGSHSGCNKT